MACSILSKTDIVDNVVAIALSEDSIILMEEASQKEALLLSKKHAPLPPCVRFYTWDNVENPCRVQIGWIFGECFLWTGPILMSAIGVCLCTAMP